MSLSYCINFWTRTEQVLEATSHKKAARWPPIMKSIQDRWSRNAGHCWRSRDKLISDIPLLTPSHGRAKAGWPARTYIHQVCTNTGYSLENLPGVMDDKNGWWERVREICAGSPTWWWPLGKVFSLVQLARVVEYTDCLSARVFWIWH